MDCYSGGGPVLLVIVKCQYSIKKGKRNISSPVVVTVAVAVTVAVDGDDGGYVSDIYVTGFWKSRPLCVVAFVVVVVVSVTVA